MCMYGIHFPKICHDLFFFFIFPEALGCKSTLGLYFLEGSVTVFFFMVLFAHVLW